MASEAFNLKPEDMFTPRSEVSTSTNPVRRRLLTHPRQKYDLAIIPDLSGKVALVTGAK